jgi:YHS domain-containing protein
VAVMLSEVIRLPVRRTPLGGEEEAMIRGTSVEVDPVCEMTIAPENAAGMSRVGGTAYYFCSTQCNAKFDAQPERYAGRFDQTRPASCCSTSRTSSCH